MSADEKQIGGTHYIDLGPYEPWKVQEAWLTHEEFLGYLKGCALKYQSNRDKPGCEKDMEKAEHCLQKYNEVKAKRAKILKTPVMDSLREPITVKPMRIIQPQDNTKGDSLFLKAGLFSDIDDYCGEGRR